MALAELCGARLSVSAIAEGKYWYYAWKPPVPGKPDRTCGACFSADRQETAVVWLVLYAPEAL